MLNRITTMGKLLNNKQIVYNNLREQRNAILKQWKDLGFLDGINGDWEKILLNYTRVKHPNS